MKCVSNLLPIPQESLSCSTCSSFSPSCCQVESGWDVLGALVRQGSLASWDPSLVRAVNSLSFQVTKQKKVILLNSFAGSPNYFSEIDSELTQGSFPIHTFRVIAITRIVPNVFWIHSFHQSIYRNEEKK